MRTSIRRLITLAVSALGISAAFAQAPVPAAAAGLVYYVDDTASNNGSVSCPGPVVGTTIQDGFDAVVVANTTIYVCPGDYNTVSVLLGSTNTKLIARGNVFLTANGGFTGDLLSAYSAKNFTIQGFIIDGAYQLGAGDANAIALYQSSGVIIKNTIHRWRQPNPAGTSGTNRAILVDNFGGDPANKIKIDHNTLYEFQNYGIEISSVNQAAITHNYLQWSGGGNYGATAIHLNYGTVSLISGNSLRSNHTMGSPTSSTGILLTEPVSTKVSGNTITLVDKAIIMRDYCDITNATKNTISGNTITDSGKGISIFASYLSCTGVTQGNVISSNKFNQHFIPDAGIELDGQGNGVVKDTLIKSNTFSGYLNMDPIEFLGTVTGTVESKNKSIFMVIPGA